jgi:microcystin-dependent protein
MQDDTYIGEIRLFSGVFAPQGWALCNGALLSITENDTLYGLIGTTYGGDGLSNFALPDLRGRATLHMGGDHPGMGESGGVETVALLTSNLPSHSHLVAVSNSATGATDNPSGNTWGPATSKAYSKTGTLSMNPACVGNSPATGNLPHNNMIPFTVVTYIIALEGSYPSSPIPGTYLSELRIFAFSNIPETWAQCNGQLLSVQQYSALFELLSTTYGGDGRQTFGLPNLQARIPMHAGNNMVQGQTGGEEAHALNNFEIPAHTHAIYASSRNPDVNSPNNAIWASNTGYSPYGKPSRTTMAPDALGVTGSNLPHLNMSPYIVLNICIALSGILPTPN